LGSSRCATYPEKRTPRSIGLLVAHKLKQRGLVD
jgi:hypothetical protein